MRVSKTFRIRGFSGDRKVISVCYVVNNFHACFTTKRFFHPPVKRETIREEYVCISL